LDQANTEVVPQLRRLVAGLPPRGARVRSEVRSCWICGGQSGIEAGFLLVLRFPLPILIPPTAPHSPSSFIRGWYNKSNSGRRTKWTQSHPTPRGGGSNNEFPVSNLTRCMRLLCCPVYRKALRYTAPPFQGSYAKPN
jgi:hypothetical protein